MMCGVIYQGYRENEKALKPPLSECYACLSCDLLMPYTNIPTFAGKQTSRNQTGAALRTLDLF